MFHIIYDNFEISIYHIEVLLCAQIQDLKQRVKYHKSCTVQACYFSVFFYIFKGQKIHESNFSNDLRIPLNFRFVDWTYLVGLLRWWNLQIVILSSNFEWILGRHVGFEKCLGAIFSDPPPPLYSYMGMPHYGSRGHRVKIQTLSNMAILYTIQTEI